MIKTQKVMYNMFFVHLKAYLNVAVDFAAHRGAPHRGIPDLNRTAPFKSSKILNHTTARRP